MRFCEGNLPKTLETEHLFASVRCITHKLTGVSFVRNEQSCSRTAWAQALRFHRALILINAVRLQRSAYRYQTKESSRGNPSLANDGHAPCCFLRHMTVKRVAKADMMTSGTVMAMARIGPAHGECTAANTNNIWSVQIQTLNIH